MDFRLVPQILQYFPHSFSQDVWYVASRYMRLAFAGGSEDKKKKNLPAMQKTGFNPWAGKILWRREWQPTPVSLPGKAHGQRNLVDCSPWGLKELGTIERLTHKKTRELYVENYKILMKEIRYINI